MDGNNKIEIQENITLKNGNIEMKKIPFKKVEIKDSDNKKNKLKQIINYIIINRFPLFLRFLNFISILFYYLSLEPCGDNATTCTLKKGLKFYIKLGVFGLISAISLSLLITIIFFVKKGYLNLFICIPIFLFFFIKYTGTDVDEHGLYNSLVFAIFFCLSFPILNYIFYLIYFLKRDKKKFKIIIIVTLTIILFIYSLSPSLSCDKWDYGLNNTRIDNSKEYPCHIKIPKLCFIKAYDGVFDYSKYFKPSCTDSKVRENERGIFLGEMKNTPFVNNGSFYSFGYPITTQNRFVQRQSFKRLDFFKMIKFIW